MTQYFHLDHGISIHVLNFQYYFYDSNIIFIIKTILSPIFLNILFVCLAYKYFQGFNLVSSFHSVHHSCKVYFQSHILIPYHLHFNIQIFTFNFNIHRINIYYSFYRISI